MIRRALDLILAAIALALLSVLLALAAVAVKMSSRGPVLYRQERIGRGGRPFLLYKLRTMRDDAGGGQITVTGDARVTAVGRVLRRLKLDEVPQLLNVIAGDMSIIGPRPEVARFVRYYSDEQRRILQYTPGLAGRAQLVYPHESDLLSRSPAPEQTYVAELMPKKIAVDLAYEQRRTLWTDLALMGEVLLLVAGKSYRVDDGVAFGSISQAPTSAGRDR
jgi:lipopolysaccharide/colanic/teichoic acid biosynthesis glycosyltransferase